MIKCVLLDNDGQSETMLKTVAQQTGNMTVIKTCNTAEEALKTINKNEANLLFVDLLMPGINARDIIHQVKSDTSHVVATSISKDAAADAFELEADDFILKPFRIERLIRALHKVFLKHSAAEAAARNPYLFVKDNARLVRVDMRNICQIEAMADYVNIYTTDKKYTIHSTMKGIESKLPESDFSRVHKSHIVRLDRISEIEKDTLTVEKKIVPISNSYKTNLFERLRIV